MVLTGDVHVGYAFDIKDDFDDPQSKTVATEFTCTSIASGGNGAERPADGDTYMKANPHMKYFDGRRGYVRVELGRENARGDFRTVSAITKPGGAVSTAASFVTEVGSPGLKSA
jgi:alkaline phosphatase/alkaline phosphatase D